MIYQNQSNLKIICKLNKNKMNIKQNIKIKFYLYIDKKIEYSIYKIK